MHNAPQALTSLNIEEQVSFRRIYAVSFPLFLVAALASRVFAPPPRGLFGLPGMRRSILDEARALANTTIPFAFMK